jgi:hypothetical protein
MLQSPHALTTETKYKTDIVITSHEVDDELEQIEQSSLKIVLAEFIAKGGTIVRLDKDATPYPLAFGDMIFPACSGGVNRSQTLWNILRPYTDNITLMPPHATRFGFDPYNGRSNWHGSGYTQNNDEFILWAGISKSQKFGWDVFEEFLSKEEATSEDLVRMMDYYNVQYYNPDISPEIRRVYITFTKNAHVHLYRLSQTNTSLKNVVILLFPLDDLIRSPLPEWNTYPRSFKSYVELANILKSYLDFSQLATTVVPSS